jgi:hypothetical protein
MSTLHIPAYRPPYGYRLAGQPGHERLIPGPAAEVATVRELFRLAALGTGRARLASHARGLDWPAPQPPGGWEARNGGWWSAYTVRQILLQPAYAGLRGPGGWPCEPLVDRETFNRVQALLAGRRARH